MSTAVGYCREQNDLSVLTRLVDDCQVELYPSAHVFWQFPRAVLREVDLTRM
jgi:hypothetical protein